QKVICRPRPALRADLPMNGEVLAFELSAAARRAEVQLAAVVLRDMHGRSHVDGHAADRVGRERSGSGDRQRARSGAPVASCNDLSEGEQSDLLLRAAAHLAGGTQEEIALLALAEVVAARHRRAAPRALPIAAAAAFATDPVCGMTVDVATAMHVAEHDGRKLYFCSAGCRAQFEREHLPIHGEVGS